MENQTNIAGKKKDWMLPASIVIAALLIGGAIVWSTGRKAELANPNTEPTDQELEALAANVLPVVNEDHIRGDKSAPVKVVVFTDLECPFCKDFHDTLKRSLLEFDGKIAVVYRHFPLTQIHPYASKEAEAAECVAELGGEQRFWDFTDKIFETTESSGASFTAEGLATVAGEMGIDKKRFSECLDSGKYADKIAAQTEDAVNSGGRGTPFSIVISKSGKKYPVSGAYPFESTGPNVPSFKAILEEALAN